MRWTNGAYRDLLNAFLCLCADNDEHDEEQDAEGDEKRFGPRQPEDVAPRAGPDNLRRLLFLRIVGQNREPWSDPMLQRTSSGLACHTANRERRWQIPWGCDISCCARLCNPQLCTPACASKPVQACRFGCGHSILFKSQDPDVRRVFAEVEALPLPRRGVFHCVVAGRRVRAASRGLPRVLVLRHFPDFVQVLRHLSS